MADGTQVGSIYYDLNLTTANFQAQMDAAKAKADAFGGSLTSIGDGLNHAAGAILPFSIAAAAALGVSVKAAINFDQQMELLHTQAGDTQAQVEQLTPKVEALAGIVGFSPTSLATALYHVASVGNGIWSVAQQMDILKTAAEGAQTGQADLNDTTYALTSTMSSQVEGAQNATEAMGLLNAIVGSGDMHMQDLNGAISTGFLGSAKAFGLSLQSVGAALATLTDNGEPATEAATRLRMTMSLMGAPTQAADKVLQSIGLTSTQAMSSISGMDAVLQKAGVSQTTLANDMRQPNGMLVALTDLKQHLEDSGLSASAAAAVMARSFGGGRSDAAMLTLLQNLDRIDVKYQVIGKNASSFANDWAAQQQTANQKMQDFKAEIETLGVQLGNAFLPTLEELAKDLGGVASWFGHLSDTNKKLIADFLLFIAVLGPVLKIGAELFKLAGFIADALDFLAATALPVLDAALTALGITLDLTIGWVLAIIAALILVGVGVYELIDHWKAVQDFFMHMWDDIKAHWLEVGVGMALAFGPVGIAIDGIMIAADLIITHWKAVEGFFVDVWDEIKDHVVIAGVAIAIALGPIGILIDAIAGGAYLIIKNWDTLKSWFKDFGSDVSQWFGTDLTNWFDDVQNTVSKVPGDIVGFFEALPGDMDKIWQQTDSDAKQWWGDIENFIEGIPNDISHTWDDIKNAADETWQHVSSAFDIAWDTITNKSTYINIAKAMFNFDYTHISQWYTDIDTAWQNTEGAVKKWLKNIGDDIADQTVQWWQDLYNWFAALPGNVSTWFDNTGTAIANWFSQTAINIGNDLVGWWQAMLSWFEALPGEVSREFDKTTSAIGKWFSNGVHDISTGLANWWTTMLNWFEQLPSKFTQELSKVGDAIKNFFEQLPKKLEQSLDDSGKQMASKHSESFGQMWKNTGTVGKIAAYIIGGILAAIVLVIVTVVVAFVQLGITAVQMLIKGMNDLVGQLGQWGRTAVQWVVNGILGMLGSIGNAGRSIYQSVINAFNGAENWLFSAGKSLIDGLVNGIKNAANTVFDAVKNLGDQAVSKLKGVLKIFSPSQVFHEMGAYIGQGLANGINSMTSTVGAATTTMATNSLMAINKQADATVNKLSASVKQIQQLNTTATAATTAGVGQVGGDNITKFANVDLSNASFNFANQGDVDYFMQKLGRNVQLASQGLTGLR